jgi:rhodanese-related sulfurtransferase
MSTPAGVAELVDARGLGPRGRKPWGFESLRPHRRRPAGYDSGIAAGPRISISDLLAAARGRLDRVSPAGARAEMAAGAILVDIRGDAQRAADGAVPGAVAIPRNVLEWRCDPDSDVRDPRLADCDRRVILMCDEGYQSSLAAATLRDLGFSRATDIDGGFQAWRAAGFPVEPA